MDLTIHRQTDHKVIPRTKNRIFQEITKDPRVISKDLKVSPTLAVVSVHEFTINQTLNNSVYEMVVGRKPLFMQKDIAHCLKFPKDWIQKASEKMVCGLKRQK